MAASASPCSLWLAGRGRATALPHIGLLLTLVELGAALASDGVNPLLRDPGLPRMYQPARDG